jgi:SOS response regulatory protein OraA/RecX
MDEQGGAVRLKERLRKRALNLINYAPRTADELRAKLGEKPWARGQTEAIDELVRDFETRGLVGGAGHERALRDRLFAYAVDLLARAPRTERELKRRLSRPVWTSPALVDEVIEALRRYNYVNDEEFARRFADSRAAAGKSGARRLRLELRAKGIVDRETIETAVREAVERAPEEDAIDRLVEKRLRSRDARDPNELRRLRDFLLRRGFDPDMIRDRLSKLGVRDEE